jgi:hypothetical protein
MICLPLYNFGEKRRAAVAGRVNTFHLMNGKTLLEKDGFSWSGTINGFLRSWEFIFLENKEKTVVFGGLLSCFFCAALSGITQRTTRLLPSLTVD